MTLEKDEIEETDKSVLEEFYDFYKDVPVLSSHFKLISKIGEGIYLKVTGRNI
jgi:hypothetical protein